MAAGRSVLGRGQVAQGRLPVACVVLVREVADHHWGSSRVVQWLRRGTAATSNRSTIGYGTNASTSRIAIDSDGDLAVRQLVRRASASGEFVAVYDPRRRWAVATASSRIWNTTDWRTQPPRPPTVVVVVHNGAANPCIPCTGQHQRPRARPSIRRAQCLYHPAQPTDSDRDRVVHRTPRRGDLPLRADRSQLIHTLVGSQIRCPILKFNVPLMSIGTRI